MTIRKLTHPGNILLLGFGAMLILMSLLVYMTMRQHIPMVSKDYYEQELRYQHKLDAIGNTRDYGSQFAAYTHGTYVELQLPPALSAAMEQGTVHFYCPADETQDRKEQLTASPDGVYTFNRSLLPGKRYIVKVSFTSGGKAYYQEIPLN